MKIPLRLPITLLVLTSLSVCSAQNRRPDRLSQELKTKIRKEMEAEAAKDQQKTEPKEDPLEKVPQQGILASFGTGVGSQTMGSVGGLQLDDTSVNPISASVSREGHRWKVSTSNASEKKLSINMRVEQFSKEGRRLKGSSISVRLAPGESQTQYVPEAVGTTGIVVRMTSWKAR